MRLGEQTPTILHLPPDVHSLAAAEEAIELADAYGVADGNPLAESQKITLRGACAERADGSWSATRVADFGPRQGTGKNDKIAARELAGLILFGEKLIIHTAHEFPTANESFLRLVAVFEAWDDLRRKVARIRYANGEQGIELLGKFGGGRLKYRARTGGSGRGFAKADLLVYDEAQHLAREHVAASGPAKMANPNSQTWYAGSGGLATSAVAWEIRRAALLGTGGRLAYTEMTGETITVKDGRISTVAPDPTDREVWYRCIPGLGRWVTEEAVEALYDELGPELFAREIECVWDPGLAATVPSVLDLKKWVICGDGGSSMADPVTFAIDASPDGASAAIAAAGTNADGLPHVEVVKGGHGDGTSWVAARAAELKKKFKPRAWLLDPRGPAGALIPELERAGIELTLVNGTEMVQACGMFFTRVETLRIRHLNQPMVAVAVDGARKRQRDEGWTWSRANSSVDISPLVACTLALWGHAHAPAKKNRAVGGPSVQSSPTESIFRPTGRLRI